MLGQLPTRLEFRGKSYEIRSDYRNILRIFEAFTSDTLTDSDKLYVCLKRMYIDFQTIPRDQYADAYKAAISFMENGQQRNRKKEAVIMDWVKDEQLLFPAVNKVAGIEVRAVPYMHWWTFLGYFQSIDHDDLFSHVLSIRQKRAKGKKLEKWEREFYVNNKALCSLEKAEEVEQAATPEDALWAIFNQLAAEGGE